MGTRTTFLEDISKRTGIPYKVLSCNMKTLAQCLRATSVAQRMSWAAGRETARVEDRAYSLVGLFGVNMPLLYGEDQRAFVRLQEGILKMGTDLSILAWFHSSSDRSDLREFLAISPEDFKFCKSVIRSPRMGRIFDDGMTLTMTNVGLRIERPLVANSSAGPSGHGLVLSLSCRDDDDITKIIGLKLEPFELPRISDSTSQQSHMQQIVPMPCWMGQ